MRWQSLIENLIFEKKVINVFYSIISCLFEIIFSILHRKQTDKFFIVKV